MTKRTTHLKNRLRHQEVYWLFNLIGLVALLVFAWR